MVRNAKWVFATGVLLFLVVAVLLSPRKHESIEN
jgi:hypothetical protein